MSAPEPDPATVAAAVETGSQGELFAAVRAMNGNDQLRLFAWLCAADPALVEAGRQALATLAAAAAGRRRVSANRRATLRARAKRRAAA